MGDPNQLPATVLSRRAVDLGLSESLHDRLMNRCKHTYIMLDVQYRMDPEISSFPSMRFYDSKICNGENVLQRQRNDNAPLLMDGKPYIFLTVQGVEEKSTGGSCQNYAEARCVVDLILRVREIAFHNNNNKKSDVDLPWNSASRIRVITFYQAQVSLLKRLLQQQGKEMGEVVVATVDSSQGCEADIVIVSFVRSKAPGVSASSGGSAGFLSDDRRMNVALTRAKYQLICVGNVDGLANMTQCETIHRLATNALHRNVVRQHDAHSRRNNNNTANNNSYHHHHHQKKKPTQRLVSQRWDSVFRP